MTDQNPDPTKPCACWTKTWSPHDGHCCLAPTSAEDCHDQQAAAQATGDRRVTDPWTGPVMSHRYWLTDKGYEALAAAERA